MDTKERAKNNEYRKYKKMEVRYTTTIVILVFFIFEWIFFNLPFWGTCKYPEEVYQSLEKYANTTIIKDKKFVDISSITISIREDNFTKVYDDVSLTFNQTIKTDSPNIVLQYTLNDLSPSRICAPVKITVDLDHNYNVLKVTRNFSKISYIVIHIFGVLFFSSLASFTFTFIFSFIIISILKRPT